MERQKQRKKKETVLKPECRQPSTQHCAAYVYEFLHAGGGKGINTTASCIVELPGVSAVLMTRSVWTASPRMQRPTLVLGGVWRALLGGDMRRFQGLCVYIYISISCRVWLEKIRWGTDAQWGSSVSFTKVWKFFWFSPLFVNSYNMKGIKCWEWRATRSSDCQLVSQVLDPSLSHYFPECQGRKLHFCHALFVRWKEKWEQDTKRRRGDTNREAEFWMWARQKTSDFCPAPSMYVLPPHRVVL